MNGETAHNEFPAELTARGFLLIVEMCPDKKEEGGLMHRK